MANRMLNLALAILKKHENAIEVKQIGPDTAAGFELRIKGMDLTKPDQQGEVIAALHALGNPFIEVKVTLDPGKKAVILCRSEIDQRVNLKGGLSLDNNPVGDIARKIADAGINYPGSSRFKNPNIDR